MIISLSKTTTWYVKLSFIFKHLLRRQAVHCLERTQYKRLFIFSTIATTISVYRGDTSLIEYITAGALTGAIYKANLGTAAMVVGGLLGK